MYNTAARINDVEHQVEVDISRDVNLSDNTLRHSITYLNTLLRNATHVVDQMGEIVQDTKKITAASDKVLDYAQQISTNAQKITDESSHLMTLLSWILWIVLLVVIPSILYRLWYTKKTKISFL